MVGSDYLNERLHAAIATMRNFCDAAERDIDDDRLTPTPESKIAKVHHALTWGIANAGAELESAISEAARIHHRKERENERQKKQ